MPRDFQPFLSSCEKLCWLVSQCSNSWGRILRVEMKQRREIQCHMRIKTFIFPDMNQWFKQYSRHTYWIMLLEVWQQLCNCLSITLKMQLSVWWRFLEGLFLIYCSSQLGLRECCNTWTHFPLPTTFFQSEFCLTRLSTEYTASINTLSCIHALSPPILLFLTYEFMISSHPAVHYMRVYLLWGTLRQQGEVTTGKSTWLREHGWVLALLLTLHSAIEHIGI